MAERESEGQKIRRVIQQLGNIGAKHPEIVDQIFPGFLATLEEAERQNNNISSSAHIRRQWSLFNQRNLWNNVQWLKIHKRLSINAALRYLAKHGFRIVVYKREALEALIDELYVYNYNTLKEQYYHFESLINKDTLLKDYLDFKISFKSENDTFWCWEYQKNHCSKETWDSIIEHSKFDEFEICEYINCSRAIDDYFEARLSRLESEFRLHAR